MRTGTAPPPPCPPPRRHMRLATFAICRDTCYVSSPVQTTKPWSSSAFCVLSPPPPPPPKKRPPGGGGGGGTSLLAKFSPRGGTHPPLFGGNIRPSGPPPGKCVEPCNITLFNYYIIPSATKCLATLPSMNTRTTNRTLQGFLQCRMSRRRRKLILEEEEEQ